MSTVGKSNLSASHFLSKTAQSWVQSRIVKLTSFVHFVLQSLCPIQKSLSLPGLKQLNPFRRSHFGSCVCYIVFHPFVFHFYLLTFFQHVFHSRRVWFALLCSVVVFWRRAWPDTALVEPRPVAGCDNHRTLSSACAHSGVAQCLFGSTIVFEVTHPFASFRSRKKLMSQLETWMAWDSGPLIWLSLLL